MSDFRQAGPRGPLRTLRPADTALLLMPLFSVALGYGAILPVLPGLLERLHDDSAADALPLHAGLFTGIYVGAFVVAAPLWGRVTDRRDPRGVILAGLFGYAAATLWLGVASTLFAAYLARFVAGAFAAGLVPATAAAIVSRCDEASRTRHLAWMSAAAVAGFLFGPALSGAVHGLMAAFPGDGNGALHLTAVPIWATAAVALLGALAIAVGFRTFQNPNAPPGPAPSSTTGLRAQGGLLVLSAAGAFGLGAFEVGLSLQSQRSWRFTPGELGWLFVTCSLVMLLIQALMFEWLRRRFQSAWLVIGGFLLMAAGFVAIAAVSDYGAVAGLVALIAAGSGVLLPTLSVAVVSGAGPAAGSATGYQNAAGNLGQASGSAIVGFLFVAAPDGSFAIVAMTMAVAAAAAWNLARLRGASLEGS